MNGDTSGGEGADDALLTPAEVAAMFQVTTTTIARWANQGTLTPARTVGGHRRFLAEEVMCHLAALEEADHLAWEAREAKRMAAMWIHQRLATPRVQVAYRRLVSRAGRRPSRATGKRH